MTLTSTVKAGVYGNAADNDFTLVVSNGHAVRRRRRRGATSRSSARSTSARACRSTRHVSLYGGYQLLWIDGVALASNEAAVATVTLNDDTISTDRRRVLSRRHDRRRSDVVSPARL